MKRFLCFFIVFIFIACLAVAEDSFETVWVLCQPDSYVNIREYPSGRSVEAGYAECGYSLETDQVVKNGFIHVFPLNELGEGWISTGYITHEQPNRVWKEMTISAKGRVKARTTINGKRRIWLKPCTKVMVYWMSDWAVTNKGFIKSEYLTCEE